MNYQIIRTKRKTLGLEIKDGQLLVRAPLRAPLKLIESFVHEHEGWIKKQLAKSAEQVRKSEEAGRLTADDIKSLADMAKRIIPERAAYFAKIIGVACGRITIRCQKTKWGSCSGKGNLNFNCLLMLTPPEVIDSVVVHELCHLKEMNHSDRFYKEVRRAYPDYDKWNDWLRKNGAVIMGRVI